VPGSACMHACMHAWGMMAGHCSGGEQYGGAGWPLASGQWGRSSATVRRDPARAPRPQYRRREAHLVGRGPPPRIVAPSGRAKQNRPAGGPLCPESRPGNTTPAPHLPRTCTTGLEVWNQSDRLSYIPPHPTPPHGYPLQSPNLLFPFPFSLSPGRSKSFIL
jgi:hypothetical protein